MITTGHTAVKNLKSKKKIGKNGLTQLQYLTDTAAAVVTVNYVSTSRSVALGSFPCSDDIGWTTGRE